MASSSPSAEPSPAHVAERDGPDAADWRQSRAKRVEARLFSTLGYLIVAGLGVTLRWTSEGVEHYDAVLKSGRQPVLAFWHGRIFAATYFFQRRGIVVITSENFDGEWIAGIIRRFGYGTARGSTSRGARRALLQLRREMASGKAAAFTVDGPAIVDCVVAADEMPNVPHIELDLAANYAIAKIKEAVIAATGR